MHGIQSLSLSVGLALCLAVAASWPAMAGPPQRVVSMNVCADQYLLALAEPAQVAALSLYSADSEMAYFAERAEAYPRTAGNAEEIIAFDPDLVLAGTFTHVYSRSMLRRLGYRVIELAPADSWDDVRAQTRLVAAALGHPDRAETWIAGLDAALAGSSTEGAGVAEAGHTGDGALRALQYQRRGFTAGTDTLMDAILAAAGLANAASEAGILSVGRLSLEALVRLAPDLVVFDRADIALTDVGSDLLLHPALHRAVPESMHIALPQRLTVCGGPSLAEAITTLRDVVQALPNSLAPE